MQGDHLLARMTRFLQGERNLERMERSAQRGKKSAEETLRLRREGEALADLAVGLSGTNSRPIRLEGTDALLGRAVDDSLLAALGKLVHKQASPMRSTVTAAHHRRLVAVVAAQRLLRDLCAAP